MFLDPAHRSLAHATCFAKQSRRNHVTAGSALTLLALGVVTQSATACGPPPIGWQGAGRQQELPAPQGQDAGAAADAADDTGAADDSGADATDAPLGLSTTDEPLALARA